MIAREARDYVWVMSRNPTLSDDKFEYFKSIIAGLGYDVTKLQRVPQQASQVSELNNIPD